MLAAIVGISKDKYLEVFSHERCKLAVRILNPVKKIRMGLNYINTKGNFWIPAKKGSHEARTQIRTEFLRDSAYRIYVCHRDDDIFQKLAENVKAHKSFFTLSLGLSELLADFRFVALKNFNERHEGEGEVTTVLPMSVVDEYGVKFEQGKKYFKEKIPIEMTPDRVVERYEDVLFEIQGNSIFAKTNVYWEADDGERIVFF